MKVKCVFRDIMWSFFMACGIVLLIYFFGEKPYAKEECKQVVWLMTLLLFIITMMYTVFFARGRWFYENVSKTDSGLPKAKFDKT